ncbi:MAG TPA: hypothetical protein VF190_02160 [Rhodothermales bacterium]
MYFIFDHLNATVIGATATLILVGLFLRIGEANVEQVANYHVKTQAADLATWLEDDLLRLGDNMDGKIAFADPVDSAGVTTEFTFYWDSVNTAASPIDTIRMSVKYDLSKVGTRVLDSDTISVYQLRRFQREDLGSWVASGASSDLLSSFRIDMLNRDAVPVASPVAAATASPDSIRNTRVRFSMATPFETQSSTIRQVFYGSTLMISN